MKIFTTLVVALFFVPSGTAVTAGVNGSRATAAALDQGAAPAPATNLPQLKHIHVYAQQQHKQHKQQQQQQKVALEANLNTMEELAARDATTIAALKAQLHEAQQQLLLQLKNLLSHYRLILRSKAHC